MNISCGDDRGKIYCEHYNGCRFRPDDNVPCGAYKDNQKPPLWAVIERFPHLKEQFERMDGVHR